MPCSRKGTRHFCFGPADFQMVSQIHSRARRNRGFFFDSDNFGSRPTSRMLPQRRGEIGNRFFLMYQLAVAAVIKGVVMLREMAEQADIRRRFGNEFLFCRIAGVEQPRAMA